MRIAVHTHDQSDTYTVDIMPLGYEEVLEQQMTQFIPSFILKHNQ